MPSDPTPPSISSNSLEEGGWARADESVETLFQLAAVRVRGATVQYEDERTRRALSDATGGAFEQSVRFFAGTRLAFEPSLPPNAFLVVAPMVEREARRTFTGRLRERGLAEVERDGSQPVRVGNRHASATKFTAVNPELDLPLSCWVAVWTDSAGGTVVTGGHPSVALASHLGLETTEETLHRSGESYREEFFSLLRSVV